MSSLGFLFRRGGAQAGDLAIDLGTANTLISVAGQGIVLREPTVVAVDAETQNVLAVGSDALRMEGRTPDSIQVVRPLKDGVVAEADEAREMLRRFIKKATYNSRGLKKPSVVICVPSGVTSVEKRALYESTLEAGVKEVYLVEEPMAAAIGAGLPIDTPKGSCVLDIGGGTTEVAVISMGTTVASRSIKVGGDKFSQAILEYVHDAYNLRIGLKVAEDIKIKVGSAAPLPVVVNVEVSGRDISSGYPTRIRVTSDEIRRALDRPIMDIVKALTYTLDDTPPELVSDIMYYGIFLTGGGSNLRALNLRIQDECGVPTVMSPDAMENVVKGCSKILESDYLRTGLVQNAR